MPLVYTVANCNLEYVLLFVCLTTLTICWIALGQSHIHNNETFLHGCDATRKKCVECLHFQGKSVPLHLNFTWKKLYLFSIWLLLWPSDRRSPVSTTNHSRCLTKRINWLSCHTIFYKKAHARQTDKHIGHDHPVLGSTEQTNKLEFYGLYFSCRELSG